MKYMIILVIVSCYIGLTHEIIAPRGIAEDSMRNYTKNSINITEDATMNKTTILQRINSTLTLLKNTLERDLFVDTQPKKSDINERAFIYIKSIKPVHNKIYFTQIRDDNDDAASYNLDKEKINEDMQQKLYTEENRKTFVQVGDGDNTKYFMVGNGCNNSEAILNKNKGDRKKSEFEKRDFLELLKTPLLRSLVNRDMMANKSHKLNAKVNNNQKESSQNRNNLPFRPKNQFNEEYNDADTSREVDKLIEQFMNISLEKQSYGRRNNANDCNDQDPGPTTCKCKTGASETNNKIKMRFHGGHNCTNCRIVDVDTHSGLNCTFPSSNICTNMQPITTYCYM